MKFESFRDALAAAHSAYQNKDLATAAEIYRGLPEAFPGKKHAALRAADGLKRCGQWSDAVVLLRNAVERWPESPMYLTHLAAAYSDIGESAMAAEYLRRSLERDSGLHRDADETPQWKQLGDLYSHAQDFERAAASYERLLAAEPLNVEAILCRGNALLALGRIDEALADYRRAVAIQPENAEALLKLGGATLEYGSAREAVDYLHRALAADPRNLFIYADLSLGLSVLGLFDNAVNVAEQGFEIERTPLGDFALGTALVGLRRFDEAADVLRPAAEAAPNNIRILLALAEAETAREDYFAAERVLQQALVAEPENVRARFMLAALHGEAVDAAPAEVMVDIFDLVAARYDHQLVPSRGYEMPAAAATLLEEKFPEQSAFHRALDLGCGTGLVTAALRDAFRIDVAVGVDIAPRMIDIAAQKNLYDRLIVGEAVPTTEQLGEPFDLITAIELAPYFGSLSSLLTAVHARLAANGLFLCSIEVSGGAARELKRSGRFAHSVAHVEDLARTAGLEVIARRELPLHRTGTLHTTGALLLFRRA